jgi:DinB family
MSTWRLMAGERELFAIPRMALLRSIMLNHWYHHRGQLSVYLRELGVPIPSIYGPSADENPFARECHRIHWLPAILGATQRRWLPFGSQRPSSRRARSGVRRLPVR